MAQKDIEAIAEQMRIEEEARKTCDEAYERAQEEERQLEAEEFEQIEDEIIDPATMGFIDSEQLDAQLESDPFYSESEVDTFNEDVSGCVEKQQPVDEAEGYGSIEVDVYNEDGFGEHFASEVMKNVPGVSATVKKNRRPNGDIVVKMHGSKEDLQRAFAYYVGEKDYMSLSPEDKEEFESLLVFDDGDTLAEADYREAVAHCLDPIGVNASTADLVAQDTCAINLIREEKMRRKAKKMAKALCENEYSELSDEDLDQLEGISDAIQSGKGVDGMTDDELAVWNTMLKILGCTQEEWDKMTPEQQERRMKNNDELSGRLSKTGFARYHTKFDPKTGKWVRYQNQYQAFIPKEDDELGANSGERFTTAFNPDYEEEDSMYQHPRAFKIKKRKETEKLDQQRRQEYANIAMDKGEQKLAADEDWLMSDFAGMLTALNNKERKELMEELVDEIKEEVVDKAQAAKEVMVIKKMFGQDVTMRDLGAAFGGFGTGAMEKFCTDTEGALFQAMRRTTGNPSASRQEFMKIIMNDGLRNKFKKVLVGLLNAKKSGKNPIDADRTDKHKDWMKMLKDLSYSPKSWDKLSTDEQLRLTDQYYASKEKEI